MLTADALIAAARTEAGLTDLHDFDVEPLERFLASVTTETPIGPEGLGGLQMDVVRLLVNRLRHAADLTAHPEIADEAVSDPIVITGLPRTGTTKLQRLMAADPDTQSVALWRLLFPAPLPLPSVGGEDPRVGIAREFQSQLSAAFPEFLAAHTMQADEPEEEALLAQMTFDRLGAFDWFYDTPSYHSWLAGRSQAGAYAYLREILQYLQWQDGGRRDRPWVLKTPLHTGNIGDLLQVFPDATVVHCHRDPVEAVTSFCAFVEIIRRTRGHTVIDRQALGTFLLGELSTHWERNLAQRPDLPERQILDVRYADICADPLAAVENIHAARGGKPSEIGVIAMHAWDEANPPGAHGRHEYAMATYDLSEDRIRAAFAGYYARFGDLL